MVASADHGEGTSTVALNLAVTLASRSGLSVVLAEANFRSPAPSRLAGVEAGPGLSEVLAGAAPIEAAIAGTDVAGLRIVPAGDPAEDAPRLLDSPRLGAVIAALAAQSDLVILDGPPVLPYADALSLASKVDRVILVTQAGRTQRGRLEQATGELTNSGASILGVVLNRKATHAPPWLQRYLNL
jgi:non-specific protein-tyrosine kinase